MRAQRSDLSLAGRSVVSRTARLLAAGVAVLAVLFPAITMARRQEPPVVVFSDANFSGRAQALDVGNYDINDLGVGNDQISSVHVAPGYRVILYKDEHFSGKTRVLTADAADLGKFNDDTSSIRVERGSQGGGREPAAVIYSDDDFRGRAQELGPGSYDLNELRLGNDKLSSLRVSPGCRVTLFADQHFSGAAVVVTSDVPSLSRFNDATSSLRVDCR